MILEEIQKNCRLRLVYIDDKLKFIGAQLSVNVVAIVIIDSDADVHADDVTDSTAPTFSTLLLLLLLLFLLHLLVLLVFLVFCALSKGSV